MRARINVSTDVAAIGIWDRASEAHADTTPLETLAHQGQACIVRLGGDSGGAVEVFIDEDVPDNVLGETTPIGDDGTIVVRSGEVVIDGIEYFDRQKDIAGRAEIEKEKRELKEKEKPKEEKKDEKKPEEKKPEPGRPAGMEERP